MVEEDQVWVLSSRELTWHRFCLTIRWITWQDLQQDLGQFQVRHLALPVFCRFPGLTFVY